MCCVDMAGLVESEVTVSVVYFYFYIFWGGLSIHSSRTYVLSPKFPASGGRFFRDSLDGAWKNWEEIEGG